MGRKKGQATVEFLLMIAVLVPIILAAMSTINKKVFKKMDSWVRYELVAQSRYGYGRDYFGSQFQQTNASNISGQGPVLYAPPDSKHPLKKIRAGWN